jgi:arylsulfatase A-like enzyme
MYKINYFNHRTKLYICIIYMKTSELGTIMIVMDELIAYHNLPTFLTDKLKGYNAFKSLGVEFTNIHNNRQQCSASRASFLTGEINTGIQDDIDQSYQYNYVPAIGTEFDTIAKIYKQNDNYKTAYFGKAHIDSGLATSSFSLPQINTNSRGVMKKYGFDTYSTFGDTFYATSEGIFNDNRELECIMPPNSTEYDYQDPVTRKKYNGIIPFLKARLADGAKFHAQYHIMNPHDTSEFIQNFTTTSTRFKAQFFSPFIKEQTTNVGYTNPYFYDNSFPDAYIKHKNLTTNYFEDTFDKYKTKKNSLPFLESYNCDYASSPNNNSIFPWYVSMQQSMASSLTFATDSKDIASWKNLINNYYGLVIEADTYVYAIYKFLKKHKLLDRVSVVIMSDHGDQMSAHGLRQKGYPFKESTNVPFIICSPFFSNKLKGTKSDILGSLIDLNPTLEVLSNLQNVSYRFIRTSLVKWSKCGILKINTKKHKHYSVINVINSTMFQATYAFYGSWYKAQTSEIQSMVINNPRNLFEFVCPYTMIITKHNKKQYKFCRYFTWFELFSYNFKHNSLLSNPIDFSTMQTLINASKFSTEITNLTTYLQTHSITTFNAGYTLLNAVDSMQLYLFMTFITIYTSSILSNLYILPGSLSTYDDIKGNSQYAFFCYNMTDDVNEITNLADPNYPARHNSELFNTLNAKMNSAIQSHNMSKFTYFVQRKSLLLWTTIMHKFGSDISSYTIEEQNIFASILGTNTFDVPYTQQSLSEIFNIFLGNTFLQNI